MKYWLLTGTKIVMVLTSNKSNNDVFVIVIIIITIIIIMWIVIVIAHNKALNGQKLYCALVQHFDPCAKLNLMVG
jgi:ATP/ADP translocase